MSYSSDLNLKKGIALMICRFRMDQSVQIPEPYKEVLSCDDIFSQGRNFLIHNTVGWRNGKRSQVGIVKEELTSISTFQWLYLTGSIPVLTTNHQQPMVAQQALSPQILRRKATIPWVKTRAGASISKMNEQREEVRWRNGRRLLCITGYAHRGERYIIEWLQTLQVRILS